MVSDDALANGIRLHYHRTGGDGPPLVLAHGVTDSGMCWWPFAQALAPDFDLILYDARGHGRSEKPDDGYDIETLASDLIGLVETLKLKRPILMGHSMGGATAAVAAARRPELPRAVILEDPVHIGEPPAMTEEFLEMWHDKITTRNAMTEEDLIEFCREDEYPGWLEVEYEPWAEAKRLVTPRVVGVFPSFPRLGDFFPRIVAPTLILRADGDERHKRRDQEIADLLPDGRLVHVEGAGHNVRRDRPGPTLELVEEFLEETLSA